MDIRMFEQLLDDVQVFSQLISLPPYSPRLSILDRKDQKTDEKILRGVEPKRGVFVLVKPPECESNMYGVSVGYAGVDKRSTDIKYEENTLYKWIQNIRGKERPHPRAMENWKKAILLYDWEQDIIAGAKIEGKGEEKDTLTDLVMEQEVKYLRHFFVEKLKGSKASKEIPFEVLGKPQHSYFLPNPDSLRYQYYVVAVMQLLRKLTEDGIESSDLNE